MDSRILDELEACYADELSLVSKDLGSLENEVVTLMRELGRGLIQRVVSKQRNGYKGSSVPCSCGHWMRFVGYRSKTIHTLLGWITLERPYYYCPKCGASCFPYDQASGLGPECLSAGLAKACCMLAVNNSFSETSRMVEEVFGQGVSDKTIERVVHQVGSVVLQQQRESLDTFRKDRQVPVCDARLKGCILRLTVRRCTNRMAGTRARLGAFIGGMQVFADRNDIWGALTILSGSGGIYGWRLAGVGYRRR